MLPVQVVARCLSVWVIHSWVEWARSRLRTKTLPAAQKSNSEPSTIRCIATLRRSKVSCHSTEGSVALFSFDRHVAKGLAGKHSALATSSSRTKEKRARGIQYSSETRQVVGGDLAEVKGGRSHQSYNTILLYDLRTDAYLERG
ncbi:hypothetical protein Naga_101278g1 [Nannochloropsis gaditana]|uniref:Uncharacterized protein n=1 Tax=Nannochloropsis gaditana TaxID=72520 RepID=W7TU08_9STRA|nr:hypothetical protein Naga_101278g1 [Nannochloropsis gaditana]